MITDEQARVRYIVEGMMIDGEGHLEIKYDLQCAPNRAFKIVAPLDAST